MNWVGRLGKRGGDFAPADLRLAVAGILHAVQEVVCRDVVDLDLEAVDGPLPTEKAGDLGPCHIEEPGIVLVADQLEYGPIPAGAAGESGAVGPAPGLLSRPCADGVLVPIRLPGFLYGRLEMGQLKRASAPTGSAISLSRAATASKNMALSMTDAPLATEGFDAQEAVIA